MLWLIITQFSMIVDGGSSHITCFRSQEHLRFSLCLAAHELCSGPRHKNIVLSMNTQAAVNMSPLRPARHLPPPYPSLCSLLHKNQTLWLLSHSSLRRSIQGTHPASWQITLPGLQWKAQSLLLYATEKAFYSACSIGVRSVSLNSGCYIWLQ